MLISIIIISHIWSNCVCTYAFALFVSPSSSSSFSSPLYSMYNDEFFVFFPLLYLPDCVRSFLFLLRSFSSTKTNSTNIEKISSLDSLSFSPVCLRRKKRKKKKYKGEESASLVITASCQIENEKRINIIIVIFSASKLERSIHTFISIGGVKNVPYSIDLITLT